MEGFLKERFPQLATQITGANTPEAWDALRAKVASDTHLTPTERDNVLEIIDNPRLEADAKERALRGTTSYRYLYRNYYPLLRHTSIITCLPRHPHILNVGAPIPGEISTDVSLDGQPRYIMGRRINLRDLYAFTEGGTFFAIKTNLLFDAALAANLGFEIGMGRRWSLDVPVWYSPWDITSTWRLRLLAIQPELRWWPRGNRKGWYVGVHGHVVGYNVSWGGEYRYQDPNHALWGLGIGAGYNLPLDKRGRWNMEFAFGAGFAKFRYDAYLNVHNGRYMHSGHGEYWGLTRAGVTLSYRFNSYEPVKRIALWT